MMVPWERKKRQADYIAPLQPLILAAFRPWGGSVGAGRVRPAGCKYIGMHFYEWNKFYFFPGCRESVFAVRK